MFSIGRTYVLSNNTERNGNFLLFLNCELNLFNSPLTNRILSSSSKCFVNTDEVLSKSRSTTCVVNRNYQHIFTSCESNILSVLNLTRPYTNQTESLTFFAFRTSCRSCVAFATEECLRTVSVCTSCTSVTVFSNSPTCYLLCLSLVAFTLDVLSVCANTYSFWFISHEVSISNEFWFWWNRTKYDGSSHGVLQCNSQRWNCSVSSLLALECTIVGDANLTHWNSYLEAFSRINYRAVGKNCCKNVFNGVVWNILVDNWHCEAWECNVNSAFTRNLCEDNRTWLREFAHVTHRWVRNGDIQHTFVGSNFRFNSFNLLVIHVLE